MFDLLLSVIEEKDEAPPPQEENRGYLDLLPLL
jgi:hypothetical protein